MAGPATQRPSHHCSPCGEHARLPFTYVPPKRRCFQNRTAASLQLRHAGVFAQREFALRTRRRRGPGCPSLAWGRPAAVRVQRPGPGPSPSPSPRPPQRPVLGAAPREGRRAPPCGKPLTKQLPLRGGGPGGCETRSGPFARDKTQARRLRSHLPRTPQARGPARLREAVSSKGLLRSELSSNHAQTSGDYKRQMASSKMLTYCVTLSGITCFVSYRYKRCSTCSPNRKPPQQSEGNNCF